MEFEAPPRQLIKRAATAPVEGQEATRLAGGRTGHGMTFYDGRPRTASACEVGDCGTDRATTANHDARARTHRRNCSLFNFRNGCGPTGDLDSVANNSAKYSASERRDVGYDTPCGFSFILTNDAECLRPAALAPHGHSGPEMHFTFIGCWFDDFCSGSSCIPVAKFALGCCDRPPVVFSYGGLICCFETGKCPLDRSKAFSCYEIRMRRHRPIRQVVNLVLNFLNERAAHVL